MNKTIMNKTVRFFGIAISLMFLIFSSIAQQITVTCDQDAKILSSDFANNWQPNVYGPYHFISIANKPMGDKVLSGALHAPVEPVYKNPELNFSKIVTNDVSHYGLWQIDCQYKIKNSEMADLPDNYLHMTADISDHDYKCKIANKTTVICNNI